MRARVLTLLTVAAVVAGLMPAFAAATDGSAQKYIVLYKSTPTPNGAASAITKAGGTVIADYKAIGVVIAESSSPTFAATIRRATGVEGAASTAGLGVQVESEVASPDELVEALSAPIDDTTEPLWGRQWDMVQINTPDAHEINTGNGVTVADLDTGLDFTHPDLAANYDAANSADCSSGAPTALLSGNDQNGHGTHTAGTIAAAFNGVGIVGTAPDVNIAGVKSSNDAGYFFPEMVVCSYMWVAAHADDIKVTNNSYFADPWLFNCANDADQRAIWKAEQRAIAYAQSKGVTVVASMGNFNDDLAHPTQDKQSPDDTTPVTREISNACRVVPNEVPGVVGVSATGPYGSKARYSNYGSGVTDVAAPGGDSRCNASGCLFTNRITTSNVLSTYPSYLYGNCGSAGVTDQGATYCYLAGTSMASPHAAGVAALIWSSHPNATASKVAALLGSTATPTACPTEQSLLDYYAHYVSTNNGAPSVCTGGTTSNSWYGQGIIDAYEAVTH